jgi:alkanesulfonate monooxygenase SsuD/methylene tetrahydromethanopterin reductase-like flavin-dependent oxidoreductase (luciferase family)
MYPKPAQKPRPPILIGGYVDRVLKRAAIAGDGWLTYFYTPESFARSWAKIRDFGRQGGKDPDALLNANQLPIMIGKSRAQTICSATRTSAGGSRAIATSFAACPIPSLRWTKADSNRRSPHKRKLFFVGHPSGFPSAGENEFRHS